MVHIILPFDKDRKGSKDKAYKQIMDLFKQYQGSEDKTYLAEIQNIVNQIDSRFYIEFKVDGQPKPYRIMFVPDRMKDLGATEVKS